MRQLEEENLRLKKLVADLSLDKAMLQDVLAKELTLARLREWVRDLQARYGASRDRSVLHYKSAAALSATALWRQTTVHSACESGKSPKPGFIMATGVHVMLRREGWRDNHKRIYRLYREQGSVPASQTPAAEQIGAAATTAASGAVSESCLGHGFCL